MSSGTVYLTKAGLKKLSDELDFLKTQKRQQVALRLHDAMEGGELIDNAEYEAAKNEQAFVEGRILELEHLISQAHVIKPGGPKDLVRIGSTVVIKEARKPPETYTIVGATEADPEDGLISNESPLGIALLDKKIGDKVEVQAPAGVLKFRIVKIK